MGKLLEIFRAGTHTAMSGDRLEFNEAALEATAAAYDPSVHEAPLVVGHPRHDDPAYGWVNTLLYSEGSLQAEPDQIDPGFQDLVNAGRFKKISASFYAPDSVNNPVPGVFYLRHVGFLGASPPAIKGMKAIEFEEGDEGVVTVEFENYSEAPMEDDQNKILEQTQALENKVTELSQREAAIHRRERALEFTEALDGLVAEGKILAANKANHLKQLQLLDSVPKEALLDFAEGDYNPVAEYLETLKQAPKQVEFGEVTGEDPAPPLEITAELVADGIEKLQAEAAQQGKALSFAEAQYKVLKGAEK